MKDLRGISTFREAARAGNFSNAARKLAVTPAAISRAISRLEGQLGIRLFSRTTSEFQLTAEGRELLRVIGSRLDDLEVILEEFRIGAGTPVGRLRVSLTNSHGKFYVLPRLPKFLEQNPQIEVEIGFDDNRRNLIASGFDVGTSYGAPDDEAYISRVVCRPQLILVASPDYLARRGVPRKPEDLVGHDAVNVRFGGGPALSWEFLPRPGNPAPPFVHQPTDHVVLSDQIDGVVQAAAAGLGLTVCHSYSALHYLNHGLLKTLLTDYDVHGRFGTEEVHVFFPHREHVSPRVRNFVQFLVDETSDNVIDAAAFAA